MTLMLWAVSTFKAPCPIFPANMTLTSMFSNSPAILDLHPHPCGEGIVSLLRI